MKLRGQMPELDVSAECLNSRPLTKSDVTGAKPVLVYFWAVSCNTCKQSMRNIKAISYDYKDVINVITVHMPLSEQDKDLAEVQRMADKYNIKEPIIADHEHRLTDLFKNRHVPTYYLFDASGQLRHQHTGNGGIQLLRRRLDRTLTE